MLTKRVNILFDEDLWRKIVSLAKTKGVSVGELVRNTLKERYFSDDKTKKRIAAYEDILKIRKRVKGVDYKELINYGRKY